MPMQTTYLVDTENVANAWMDLIPGMGDRDRVYLLYTENSPPLACGGLGRAGLCSLSQVLPVRAYAGTPGKSALDFQLVSLLGSLIARDGGSRRYAIVSNDRGYDPVVSFWADRGVRVTRVPVHGHVLAEVEGGSRPCTCTQGREGSRRAEKGPVPPAKKRRKMRKRQQGLLPGKTNVPRDGATVEAVLDAIGDSRLTEKTLLRRLKARFGEADAKTYFGTIRKILPELYGDAPAEAGGGAKKKKKKKQDWKKGKRKKQKKTDPAPADAREARRELLSRNTNISKQMEYVLDALEAAPSGAKEDVIAALAETIGEHGAKCCVGMFAGILPLLYGGQADSAH